MDAELRREPLLGDFFPVIGIMAEDRAGKDTMAAHLVEAHGFNRLAFADRMKECMAAMPSIRIRVPFNGTMPMGKALEYYSEDWVKENCPDYRALMVEFGTRTVREAMGLQTFWIDSLTSQANAMRNWIAEPAGLVIPDVRDPLEAKAVTEELGGYLIELRSNRGKGHYAAEGQLHEMRRMVGYTLTNNTTIEDLQRQVDNMLAVILRDYDYGEQ